MSEKVGIKAPEPTIKNVKPPKKIFTNPAFQAMGIPAMKLPSRNWTIFWLGVSAAIGGFAYDKYQQKQIITKYTNMVKPLAEEKMNTRTVPRKITVFIAPPPSDYLETSLKIWRRYVKPVLYYAGLDYDVIEEDRQGVIRTTVANRIRELRRDALQIHDKPEITENLKHKSEVELTRAEEIELGQQYKKNFDWRDAIGIFYKHEKPKEIISEDVNLLDPLQSGGVICLGRGAYKEYLAGLHEGLLGPVEPPAIENTEGQNNNNSTDTQTRNSATIDIHEEKIKVMEQQLEEIPIASDDTATEDKTESSNNKETEEKKMDEETDTKVLKPFILPSEYESSTFPPLELQARGDIIRDDKTSIPILIHQPLLVIPVPNLIGFLAIPQRIYRFYRKRYLTEEICSEVTRLVQRDSLRQFQISNDLQLAVDEEHDWPSSWIKQGLKRKSEWTRDVVVDPRIGTLIHTCNKPVPDDVTSPISSLNSSQNEN